MDEGACSIFFSRIFAIPDMMVAEDAKCFQMLEEACEVRYGKATFTEVDLGDVGEVVWVEPIAECVLFREVARSYDAQGGQCHECFKHTTFVCNVATGRYRADLNFFKFCKRELSLNG